jgi:hypothetical protein
VTGGWRSDAVRPVPPHPATSAAAASTAM